MARLLLHIGAHKTGTSYVQRLFHANRNRLAPHGIIYPDIGPNRAHHILVTPWIDVPEIPASFFRRLDPLRWLHRKTRQDAFFDRFVAQYSSRKGIVFLSAEIFSRAELQCVDMPDLARRLAPFEDVRIVYTARHQTDYIQSIWLQLAKNGNAGRFDHFLEHALRNHLASGLWVDHGRVVDHVLTGFSPQQLILLDYEASRRHPEGIAGPFLDLLESPLRLADMQSLSRKDSNVSPDALASWLAHSIDWPSPARGDLVKRLQPALAKCLQRHGRKRTTLYTRDEYERVGAAFAEANARLDGWLGTDPSNHGLSGPAPADTLLFRDDLNFADWIALMRQVAANPGHA